MTDKESIIQKIQKLLAMSKANGASENEAMTAANRVQKLLQEHNLSLGDIKDNEIVEPIDSESFEAEKDKWKSWIVSATAKLYFCTVYSSSKLDERYRKVKQNCVRRT
jgi:predicted oxidoreductase (fatty acid repression mutant protein)